MATTRLSRREKSKRAAIRADRRQNQKYRGLVRMEKELRERVVQLESYLEQSSPLESLIERQEQAERDVEEQRPRSRPWLGPREPEGCERG